MKMEMELKIIVREIFSNETVMENREREAEKSSSRNFFSGKHSNTERR